MATIRPNNTPPNKVMQDKQQKKSEPQIDEEDILTGSIWDIDENIKLAEEPAPQIYEEDIATGNIWNIDENIKFAEKPAGSSFGKSSASSSDKTQSKEDDYTYELLDISQIDNLMSEYNSYKTSFSEAELKYYDNIINNYKNIKQEDLNVENITVLKTFLALKKLAKYDYTPSKIPITSNHKYDESTNMLGQYYNDFTLVEKETNSNSEYCKQLDTLYAALYTNKFASNRFLMLENDNKTEIEKFSKEILDKTIAEYDDSENFSSKNLYSSFDKSATYICDIDNKWNNWNVQINIYENGLSKKDGGYLPKELCLVHEFYHLKQTKPGERENYSYNHREIGATIETIVLSDEIHKKINNIPIDTEVQYGKNLQTSTGKIIELGNFANFFREIKEKYNCNNYEQVLLTTEVREFLETL